MANFGVGSEVPFSFSQLAGMPLDSLSTANSVSRVLTADIGIRYLGLMVFIEDENAYYYFSKHELPDGSLSSGVEDSDFQKFGVGGQIESISIVDNYSLLTPKEKDSLAYVKNDYIDTINNKTYESGIYLYTINDDTWTPIISKQNVETEKEVDEVYDYPVEIEEGVSEEVSCTKTVQTVGLETITTIIANEDSLDGATIKAGDTIVITKTINGIVVYEYNILDNSVIEDPFA